MNNKKFVELISLIEVENINQYLINNDWNVDDSFPNKKVKLFKKYYRSLDSDEYDEFEVLVPQKKKFSDFNIRIMSLIETLSTLEEKSNIEIVNDIRDTNVDILEMRLVDKSYNNGTISLNTANSITAFIRDIIVSSACVEENPRPIYQKPTKKAIDYANIFRFGQTKYGSYVMSVESDLSNDISNISVDDDNLSEEVPFQRRIIKRIQKSLYQLSTLQYDNSNFAKDSYIDGLNGNMCEIFSKLKELKDDLKIEYKFNMSSTIKDNENIPSKIILNKDAFFIAQKLTEKFKKMQKTQKICIKGKVKRIDFDYETPNDKSAYVTINFLYKDDKRYHNVKLYLEDKEYNLACDSLRDRNEVMVEGILDKSTRKWCLDSIEKFELLKAEK